MALIRCRECGAEVSSEAMACPNCGRQQDHAGIEQALREPEGLFRVIRCDGCGTRNLLGSAWAGCRACGADLGPAADRRVAWLQTRRLVRSFANVKVLAAVYLGSLGAVWLTGSPWPVAAIPVYLAAAAAGLAYVSHTEE